MPLFICDECDCIENTTCGHYWCINFESIKEGYRGKALCSECCPPDILGKDSAFAKRFNFGKWHGEFSKDIMDEEKVKEKLEKYEDYFIYMGKFEYLRKKKCEICQQQEARFNNKNIMMFLCVDCLMEIEACISAQGAYLEKGEE